MTLWLFISTHPKDTEAVLLLLPQVFLYSQPCTGRFWPLSQWVLWHRLVQMPGSLFASWLSSCKSRQRDLHQEVLGETTWCMAEDICSRTYFTTFHCQPTGKGLFLSSVYWIFGGNCLVFPQDNFRVFRCHQLQTPPIQLCALWSDDVPEHPLWTTTSNYWWKIKSQLLVTNAEIKFSESTRSRIWISKL